MIDAAQNNVHLLGLRDFAYSMLPEATRLTAFIPMGHPDTNRAMKQCNS